MKPRILLFLAVSLLSVSCGTLQYGIPDEYAGKEWEYFYAKGEKYEQKEKALRRVDTSDFFHNQRRHYSSVALYFYNLSVDIQEAELERRRRKEVQMQYQQP